MNQAMVKSTDDGRPGRPQEQYDKIYKSLRQRSDLSASEKLLAAMILNLQQTTGWAIASVAYLSTRISLGRRQVSKLLSGLEAKRLLQRRSGKASGTASQYRIILRKQESTAIRIAPDSLPESTPDDGGDESQEAVENGVDNLSQRELLGAHSSAQGVRTKVRRGCALEFLPPYKEEKKSEKKKENSVRRGERRADCRRPDENSETAGTIFQRKIPFDPHRVRKRGTDYAKPQQRLADAFRSGMMTHARLGEGRILCVSGVKWSNTQAILQTADPDDPDEVWEVRIPMDRLRQWKFWR